MGPRSQPENGKWPKEKSPESRTKSLAPEAPPGMKKAAGPVGPAASGTPKDQGFS